MTIEYFVPDERKAGGAYVTVTGRVWHISVPEKVLVMEDGTVIGLEDIFAISGFQFENLIKRVIMETDGRRRREIAFLAINLQDSQELILKLITAVGSGDADGFMKLFQSIFAGIPYNIHVKDEHYYQTVCYVVFDLLKLMVQAEVCTSNGRIDMMVAAGNWIYVIEFKLNKSADEAMKQIENKDYAAKYRKDGKRIMLIGVNFDFVKGSISDWIKEEYL